MSRRASQPSETSPLLENGATSQQEPDEHNASAIAIASAFGDPNASAFATVPIAEDEEPAPTPAAPVEETERSRAEVFTILAGLWIGTFVSALDGTIVATLLKTIGSEFGVSNTIAWLGTSYLMSQTAFQPLYGRFSDIFGRKPATLFASVVFAVGTLACGLSTTFPGLIAARAFAGIGGGGLTTMSSIVTSDLVPLRSRGTYQGLGNIVYAFGAAIGGPLGGALGDSSIGWRWAFLLQIPLCILHFGIVAWKVNIPSGPGDVVTKLKRIDYLGCITLVAGVALLLVGLSMGGNQYKWSDPITYGTILGGLGGITLFVLVEKYVAREPILAPRILFSRTPGFVSLTNWFASMAQFGIIYQCPLYFSAVEETTGSYAGLHLIPNAIFASTASLLGGIYMARTGKYKTLLVLSGVLAVLGPALMIGWQRGKTPTIIYWLDMIPAGIGYGAIITITLVALISAVEPRDMAASTGVSYLFRATGSVLGISLSTAILQNSLSAQLSKKITGKHAAKIIYKIRTDVDYIRKLPKAEHLAALEAYQYAMRTVFIAITVAAVLSLLCILPIPQHALPTTLNRKK